MTAANAAHATSRFSTLNSLETLALPIRRVLDEACLAFDHYVWNVWVALCVTHGSSDGDLRIDTGDGGGSFGSNPAQRCRSAIEQEHAKSPLTDDFGTFRIDHTLNSKWHLNGSFSYSRDIAYDSTPIVLDIRNPANIINSDLLPNWTNAFIFGATAQLTSSLTNNIHIGDVRNRNGALRPQFSAIAQELSFPGTQESGGGYVAISPNIFTAPITMSNTVRTQKNDDVTEQLGDDLAWTKRNHVLQVGTNLQRLSLYHVHTGKVGGAVNSFNVTEIADTSYLRNVTVDVNYTLSKSLDTNQGVANDSTNLAILLNPSTDYGPRTSTAATPSMRFSSITCRRPTHCCLRRPTRSLAVGMPPVSSPL